MNHIFVELLSQMTHLSAKEQAAIESSFPIKTFEKDTFLLKEGQIARNAYFVIEGCIRAYQLLDGEEKTTAFFTEHQSVVNFNSLANRQPSRLNLVCAETSTIAILNSEKEQALYRQFPRFETFCRTGIEQMMGDQQQQLATFIALKPEQRYLKLQNERPDLLNRVPQYQIASYLGIKPETLSRIRKRLTKN
ncbi:MAG: Crp/Fnr family transcriptional regulator [Bacteroidota bacterium]